MGNSAIAYCSKSWNPLVGCPGPLVSVGCNSCWARSAHDMRHRAQLTGKKLPEMYRLPFDRMQWFPERLAEPLSWRKPQIVFVGSQTDLFNDAATDDVLDEVFGAMLAQETLDNVARHLFLVITKRPSRMLEYLSAGAVQLLKRWSEAGDGLVTLDNPDVLFSELVYGCCLNRWVDGIGAEESRPWSHPENAFPLRDVILCATACTQSELDRAAPILVELASQGWRTGLSLEPLLERVDLTATAHPRLREEEAKSENFPRARLNVLTGHVSGPDDILGGHVEWVTVGGESGPRARPCDLSWIRSVIEQCKAAGVRCFVKQMGSHHVITDASRSHRRRSFRGAGAHPIDWPEYYRVRELPEMPR